MVTESFSAKAAHIRLIVTDIDGVWTDAKMYYTADGDFMKAFSTYDGMAVGLARKAGLEVAIITGENSPVVAARAKKLGITDLFLGEQHKIGRIHELCDKYAITPAQIAYIGDDVNDLGVLGAVGLTAMACNSPILHLFTPDYITQRAGGDGAFRDFVDRILETRSGLEK